MTTYTIISVDGWFFTDFADMDAARAWVEAHPRARMKAGWVGTWSTPTRYDGRPNVDAAVWTVANGRGRTLDTLTYAVAVGRHWRAMPLPADA